MPKVELSTDDVIDAFCRMLEPGIRKNVLPQEDCNKYGVDVLYSKSDPSKFMMHFVTADMLEVNLEIDMMELQRRGKEYMDHIYGLLCDQTQVAREERQKEDTITIYNTGSHVDKAEKAKKPVIFHPKKVADAVNDAVIH